MSFLAFQALKVVVIVTGCIRIGSPLLQEVYLSVLPVLMAIYIFNSTDQSLSVLQPFFHTSAQCYVLLTSLLIIRLDAACYNMQEVVPVCIGSPAQDKCKLLCRGQTHLVLANVTE